MASVPPEDAADQQPQRLGGVHRDFVHRPGVTDLNKLVSINSRVRSFGVTPSESSARLLLLDRQPRGRACRNRHCRDGADRRRWADADIDHGPRLPVRDGRGELLHRAGDWWRRRGFRHRHERNSHFDWRHGHDHRHKPRTPPGPERSTPRAAGFTNPMTTAGDLIDGGTAGAPQRLAIGSAGQVLTVVSGAPAWAPATSGQPDILQIQVFGP